MGTRVVDPDLLALHPRTSGLGTGEAGDRARMALEQRERPGAGADLHADAPVRLEPRGEAAGELDGDATRQHGASEQELAIATGDLELDRGLDLERDLVGDSAVHAQLERVLLRCLVLLRLLEIERAPRLAVRLGHRTSADGEREEPGGRRNADRLRQRIPEEATAHGMHAHRERQENAAGGEPRRCRAAIQRDLLRIVAGITREQDVGGLEHLPRLAERAPLLVEHQIQRRGPRALAGGDAVLVGGGARDERAAQRLLTLEDPRHPGRQRRGNGRLRGGGESEQQEQRGEGGGDALRQGRPPGRGGPAAGPRASSPRCRNSSMASPGIGTRREQGLG